MKLMMFPLLLFVFQHASGLELEIQQGVESVLLPCEVQVSVSKNSAAAVWDRDEFATPTVHMRLQSGDDDLSKQNSRYKSRTSMRADALQTGDLSLTLRNPTVSDSGNYTCITRMQGLVQSTISIQLEVREQPPPPPPVWPKVLAGIMVSVAVLIAYCGCLMYRAYNMVKNSAVSILKPEEETEGAESVKLPWRGSVDLPAAVRVKWTRVQPKHGQICELVKDQDQWKLHLGEDYKGRVDMNPNPVWNRDFRLTLKKPCSKDGGVYLCVVYDQDGKPLKLTIVALWVKETWWKTIARLILCCKDPDPPTGTETSVQKWMLTDEICEILKNSCGHEKKVEGEKPPLTSESSNESENADFLLFGTLSQCVEAGR